MKYPRIEKMKVADLRPADYNPRQISEGALSGLGASIDRFGVVALPVFNKRTGTLVGGHQRLKVMESRGKKTVDVVVVDMDEIEEKALNVTLNNPAISGTFTEGLQDVLAEISEHDADWMEALNLDALFEFEEEPEPEAKTEEPNTDEKDDAIPQGKRKSFKPGQKKKVGRHKVVCSDCVSHLRTMPDNSVDSIVTDPPYGIGFMGKDWDVAVPGEEWAKECLRVLKPGGHIIAFAATRTVHRLAVAIEDAGFEIRDTISWLYWSGFPKSSDVSKLIDKAAGAVRTVPRGASYSVPDAKKVNPHFVAIAEQRGDGDKSMEYQPMEPATEDAKRWDGWGTALKPTQEPAVLARKPLIGTVAENVLAHGTGGINVDACRMGYGDKAWPGPNDELKAEGGLVSSPTGAGSGSGAEVFGHRDGFRNPSSELGRWPANIYVCKKPSMSEKGAGLDGTVEAHEVTGRKPGSKGDNHARAGRTGNSANFHPTVKPVRLMRWLIRLVTPPGGVVVDTFLGSGTTMVAAEREGFDCIGIEMSGEFAALSEARVRHAISDSTDKGE